MGARRGPVGRFRVCIAVVTLAALRTVAAATDASPDPAVPAATIRLEHFMFGPTTITVPVGATVRWLNLDGEPHTVASVDGLFRSGALDEGDGFAFTFRAPGRYRYVCSIHPQMTGTIVVTAAP